MAEIEHYVDPLDKSHKKFNNVKDLIIPLYTAEDQLAGNPPRKDMTVGEAVSKNIINNETLAYFVARTYLFMLKIGINKDGLRARQHQKTEMAHYASDCWDIEIETSYGWIEVVGHADRTCFDLEKHQEHSKQELKALRKLKEPRIKKYIRVGLKKDKIFKAFSKDESKIIMDLLNDEKMSEQDKEIHCQEYEKNKSINIKVGEKTVNLSADLVVFERKEEREVEEKFTPGVIEPAFGIGRIVYCILEHCFRVREIDDKRTFFAFPPLVAPVKVSILPLIETNEIRAFIEPLSKKYL